MVCNVCGCADFVATEYVLDEGHRAPALECLGCRALALDENAASTEAERESVKLAKALRARIAGDD